MLTKRKKTVKNQKCNILKNKKKKNGLEIWWKGSEKIDFTDDGRADDGHLRDDSSSAVQQHKAELKNGKSQKKHFLSASNVWTRASNN